MSELKTTLIGAAIIAVAVALAVGAVVIAQSGDPVPTVRLDVGEDVGDVIGTASALLCDGFVFSHLGTNKTPHDNHLYGNGLRIEHNPDSLKGIPERAASFDLELVGRCPGNNPQAGKTIRIEITGDPVAHPVHLEDRIDSLATQIADIKITVTAVAGWGLKECGGSNYEACSGT